MCFLLSSNVYFTILARYSVNEGIQVDLFLRNQWRVKVQDIRPLASIWLHTRGQKVKSGNTLALTRMQTAVYCTGNAYTVEYV